MSAALKVNKILVRRELWENRSLWMVPLVVLGLLTLMDLYMLGSILVGNIHAAHGSFIFGGKEVYFNDLPDFSMVDPAQMGGALRLAPLWLAFPFNAILQIVVFFYLLDCLYADRRDRSVLFWRSLPVSDLRTVLSKLATAVFATVGIVLGLSVIHELLLLVVALIGGGVLGVHIWVVLLHPWAIVSGWLVLAYGLLAQSLWLLPVYAWIMLASAWARKAPFLWAVLPLAGVIIAEGWLFHSAYFARGVFKHLVSWVPLAFNFKPLVDAGDPDISMGLQPVTFESVFRFLSSGELWLGFAVTAAFVAAAVWLRKNRTEI